MAPARSRSARHSVGLSASALVRRITCVVIEAHARPRESSTITDQHDAAEDEVAGRQGLKNREHARDSARPWSASE